MTTSAVYRLMPSLQRERERERDYVVAVEKDASK